MCTLTGVALGSTLRCRGVPKGLVCTDIERGGFECRPQVLLQCTPVLLRRRREGLGQLVAVSVSGIHTYASLPGGGRCWFGVYVVPATVLAISRRWRGRAVRGTEA